MINNVHGENGLDQRSDCTVIIYLERLPFMWYCDYMWFWGQERLLTAASKLDDILMFVWKKMYIFRTIIAESLILCCIVFFMLLLLCLLSLWKSLCYTTWNFTPINCMSCACINRRSLVSMNAIGKDPSLSSSYASLPCCLVSSHHLNLSVSLSHRYGGENGCRVMGEWKSFF